MRAFAPDSEVRFAFQFMPNGKSNSDRLKLQMLKLWSYSIGTPSNPIFVHLASSVRQDKLQQSLSKAKEEAATFQMLLEETKAVMEAHLSFYVSTHFNFR